MNQPSPAPHRRLMRRYTPDRASVGQAAGGGFQHKQGQSNDEDASEVADDKGAAAVLAGHVGEAPEIPQAHGGGNRRKYEGVWGCPFRPVRRGAPGLEIHFHRLHARMYRWGPAYRPICAAPPRSTGPVSGPSSTRLACGWSCSGMLPGANSRAAWAICHSRCSTR